MHFDSPQLARDFIASSWETLNRLRIEKKWSEAEALSGERLSQARQLYRAEKSVLNARLLASAICGRACLRFLGGDIRKAHSTYAAANRLRESTLDSASDENFLSNLAYGYFREGRCLHKLDRHREAVALYNKAVDVYENIDSDNARHIMAVCFHNLGSCYYVLRSVDEAFQFCARAEKMYCDAIVAGVKEAEGSLTSFRAFVPSVLEDHNDAAKVKSYLRHRIQHYESLPPRTYFNTVKLWLNNQLLDVLLTSGEKAGRIKVAKSIRENTLKLKPTLLERAECERLYSGHLADGGSYSDALRHNFLAEKYLEKHSRASAEDVGELRTVILHEQECFKESVRKYPDPAARKNVLAKAVDHLSLALFSPDRHIKSEFVCKTQEYLVIEVSMLLIVFAFLGPDFKDFDMNPSVWQVVALLLGMLLGGQRWTIPLLKKLADGFESKFLSKLARKLKLRLPASLANTVLVESKGDLQFRVWAVGFAFPIGMLVQTADDLAGRDLAIWVFVFVSPRPTIRDRELRRCMSAINLSMPHSANRQLFSLLARGTHPLGLGTC